MGRYTHSTGWGLFRLKHARYLESRIEQALAEIPDRTPTPSSTEGEPPRLAGSTPLELLFASIDEASASRHGTTTTEAAGELRQLLREGLQADEATSDWFAEALQAAAGRELADYRYPVSPAPHVLPDSTPRTFEPPHFDLVLRGYDRIEVDEYMTAILDENAALRRELEARVGGQVNAPRSRRPVPQQKKGKDQAVQGDRVAGDKPQDVDR